MTLTPRPDRHRRAVVLQHVAHEGPARIAPALAAAGFAVEVRRLDRGDPVPSPREDLDALVVMGGPMGVGDLGDPRFPYLTDEVALLAAAIEREVPTIGVCLGAQLIAHAAGARVYPNRIGEPPVLVREVGWGALHLVADDPVLEGLDRQPMVLHWHGDTFDLPAGATLLASTLHCPHQMFRLGARTFGLQFHVEVDEPDVLTWLELDAGFVRACHGPAGAARIAADTRRFITRAREQGDRLITNILTATTAGR